MRATVSAWAKRLLAVAALCLALLPLNLPSAAAIEIPCGNPALVAGDCGGTTPTPTPAPQPTATAGPAPVAPSTSASATPSASASATPTPGAVAGDQPTSGSQDWSTQWQKGAEKVATTAADQYDGTFNPLGSGLSTAYALFFAIGLFLVLPIMLIIQAARTANSAIARAEFMDQIPRFILYTPLMMAFPMLMAWVTSLESDLNDALVKQAGGDFGSLLHSLAHQAGAGNIWAILGGAVTTIFACFFIIVFGLLWIVEDAMASWGVGLVTVLMPLVASLSLYRPWRSYAYRVLGVLIGISLVPTITRLGFWLSVLFAKDQTASAASFMGMLRAIIILASCTSAPLLLSYLMPAILPSGSNASGGAGGSAVGEFSTAGQHAGSAQKGLARMFSSSSDAGSADAGAAGTVTTGGGGGPAGGGAAGGGAASGGATGGLAAGGAVVGAAVLGAVAAYKGVHNAGVSAGSTGLSAGGGGYFSDAGRPTRPASSPGGGSSSAGTAARVAADSSASEPMPTYSDATPPPQPPIQQPPVSAPQPPVPEPAVVSPAPPPVPAGARSVPARRTAGPRPRPAQASESAPAPTPPLPIPAPESE